MKRSNIIVGQSGGPTPVINMSLCGVVEEALRCGRVDCVLGMKNGLDGILKSDLVNLENRLDEVKSISRQPGAILGTSRHPLSEQEYETIITRLEEWDVGIFCYIGGNGSSRTVSALHSYARKKGKNIRFVHIPKTIDNDLDGTDHTPGYGSAAKFLSHMMRWFAVDMVSLRTTDKVEIIEVMGGNRGWLPAASALFKQHELDYPNLVYLPDRAYRMENIFADVENAFSKGGSIMMVIPDHFKADGMEQDPLFNEDPIRGNNAGIAYWMAKQINNRLRIPTRVTAPYAFYRIAPGLTSNSDFAEAYRLGEAAVRYAMAGSSGGMVALNRLSHAPYACEIKWVDLEGVAGSEKPFPDLYWDGTKHMPTPSFMEYIMPLVDNEFPNAKFKLD